MTNQPPRHLLMGTGLTVASLKPLKNSPVDVVVVWLKSRAPLVELIKAYLDGTTLSCDIFSCGPDTQKLYTILTRISTALK